MKNKITTALAILLGIALAVTVHIWYHGGDPIIEVIAGGIGSLICWIIAWLFSLLGKILDRRS